MTPLPNNEIGISDIIAYRECPQRWAFDMRRHLPMPERFKLEDGEKEEWEERESYPTSYGSAVHDAIEVVEQTQCSDEEAIDAVWPRYQHWLEPDDEARMLRDLEVYRSRVTTGYRLVGTEVEMRVPLFVADDGEMVYFRGRVDVLYQNIQNGSLFLSRDYKSGRWPKSKEEIQKDLQQWAYNWLIHEFYPECEDLTQQYDQLRYGLEPIRKTAEQRQQVKRWLIRQVKAILSDTIFKPKSNQWCKTCPLMMDCRVTHLATDWWKNRLAAMAPEKKEGRKIVVQLTEDIAGFEQYVEMLPKAKQTLKVMERFVGAVEDALKEMPQDDRQELGYALGKGRSRDVFDADAMRRMHAMDPQGFFHLVTVTKKALQEHYGEDSEQYQAVLAMAQHTESAAPLKAAS